MNQFWGNEYVKTAGDYSVVILSLVVFLAIFELVTKYNNWVNKKWQSSSCDGYRGQNVWNHECI